MASLVEDSRRAPFVVREQSPQRLVANYILKLKLSNRRRRRYCDTDRHIAQTLMGALKMIVSQSILNNMPQVCLPKDNEMVEALCFRSADPLQRRDLSWDCVAGLAGIGCRRLPGSNRVPE
jgi:hypothetical protein